MFAVSNSCVNPIVYGMYTVDFRRKLRKLCACFPACVRFRFPSSPTQNSVHSTLVTLAPLPSKIGGRVIKMPCEPDTTTTSAEYRPKASGEYDANEAEKCRRSKLCDDDANVAASHALVEDDASVGVRSRRRSLRAISEGSGAESRFRRRFKDDANAARCWCDQRSLPQCVATCQQSSVATCQQSKKMDKEDTL